MLRPALTAGLMILALAAPAAADGFAEPDPPSWSGRGPTGYGRAPRPAYAPIRRHPRPYAVLHRSAAVRPVSYGETDGTVFHAWLPRNTNLPIYNIPPPFFPE